MKGNTRGIRLASLIGAAIALGHGAAASISNAWQGETDPHNKRAKARRQEARGRSSGVKYITHTKTPGPTRAQAKRLVKKAKGKATAKARNCYRSAKK